VLPSAWSSHVAYESQKLVVPRESRLYLLSDGAFEIEKPDGKMLEFGEVAEFLRRPAEERSEPGSSPKPAATLHSVSCSYQIPPSATVIASPLIPPAASLHKKAITCATSRGSSTRFCG
jgi:hypothetical protein